MTTKLFLIKLALGNGNGENLDEIIFKAVKAETFNGQLNGLSNEQMRKIDIWLSRILTTGNISKVLNEAESKGLQGAETKDLPKDIVKFYREGINTFVMKTVFLSLKEELKRKHPKLTEVPEHRS